MFQSFGLGSKYACEHPILLRSVNLGLGTPRHQRIVKRSSDEDILSGKPAFRAWSINKSTGEVKPYVKEVYDKTLTVPMLVRCGKCAHCKKLENDQWFARCCNHLMVNCHKSIFPLFVTFTFSPEWFDWLCDKCDILPDGSGKIDYRPIYRFVFINMKKRLRAEQGENLKFDYVLVSEFGEKKHRFHFHAIFYFYDLDDLYRARRDEWLTRTIPDGSYRAGSMFMSVCTHRVVNKKAKTSRYQSVDECYLQAILEKHFSEVFGKRVRDGVPHVRRGKNGNDSVYFNGQFGYVTAFSSTSFGAFHYILGYTLKCFKDGVSTFRRQSPGIGCWYAYKYREAIYSGAMTFVEHGINPDTHVPYRTPIPRYYLKKFGDHDALVRYSLQNSVPKALEYMKDSFDSSFEVIDYDNTHFNFPITKNQIALCTKFAQETQLSLADFALQMPPRSTSHFRNSLAWPAPSFS